MSDHPGKANATQRTYAAFFDVDNTILSGSTATPFGMELLRRGVLGPRDIFFIALWTIRYKLGWAGETEMWARTTERLKGQLDDDMRAACIASAKNLADKVFSAAQREIERHRRNGAYIALITAGPRYAVEELGRQLCVDECVTAWPNIDGGRITDLKNVRLLFGEGKRSAALEICQRLGIDAAQCWAYGDSISDEQMLASVGHPVVVNPKPALRGVALRNGWPVHRWS